MSFTTVPFVSRVVGRHGKDILARDRSRAQKLLQGMNPHGPLGRELFAARGHHHHRPGHTGGGNTGGGSSGTTPPTTGGDDGVDVTDAGVTYTTSVGVGSPATQFTLLIDTG